MQQDDDGVVLLVGVRQGENRRDRRTRDRELWAHLLKEHLIIPTQRVIIINIIFTIYLLALNYFSVSSSFISL